MSDAREVKGHDPPSRQQPLPVPVPVSPPLPSRMDQYDVQEKIYDTGDVDLYKVQEKSSKLMYAIKRIFIRDLESVQREYKNLLKLDEFRYICEIYHGFIMEEKTYEITRSYWCMVMKFYPNGNLAQRIDKGRKRLPLPSLTGRGCDDELKIVYWMSLLAGGVDRIHEKKIIHRDLKPANIFLDEHEKPIIGDFGIATDQTVADSAKGTNGYVAPEVLEQPYTKSVDLYSLGCILLDLLTLTLPNGRSIEERIELISEKKYSSDWEPIVRDLLKRDPKKRGTAKELKEKIERVQVSESCLQGLSPEEAFLRCQELALKETHWAQLRLGHMYRQGQGTDQDYSKAFQQYQTLARSQTNHSAEAQQWVAFCILLDFSESKDYKEAFRLSQLGVEKNLPFAYSNLGLCYQEGRGVPLDFKQGFELYEKGAKLNDPYCQHHLARCFRKGGTGLQPDIHKAISLYLLAAKQNCAPALYFLGNCYEEKKGVEKDMKQALAYYHSAAKLGESRAQICLGRLYQSGVEGLPKDESEGFRYYELAATKGGNAYAQFKLAQCLDQGLGVKKDEKLAYQYYRRASNQKIGAAQNQMGRYCELGLGMDNPDPEQAFKYYTAAATNKNGFIPEAIANLGRCYAYGIGVAVDLKISLTYYEQAATLQVPYAIYNVARCYERGVGKVKNPTKAFELYFKASDLGAGYAMYQVGECYQNGTGVEKNLPEAERYFALAKVAGYTQSAWSPRHSPPLQGK